MVGICLGSVAKGGLPFGYQVDNHPGCTVWWAENAYKVMQDTPLPAAKGVPTISSARNETEAFQVILRPVKGLRNIRIMTEDLLGESGQRIGKERIEIRLPEYVQVTKPSGEHHQAGWYPDPLPLYEHPFDAEPGVNTPVWINVTVPAQVGAGEYTAHLRFEADGGFVVQVPVKLTVWGFTLPEVPFMRSAMGLYTGFLKDYHHVKNEAEIEQLMDIYYRSLQHYKVSPQQFYDLYPFRKKVTGKSWTGGTFDPDTVRSGRYSLQVRDVSHTSNTEAVYSELIPVNPAKAYAMNWRAKTLKEGDAYCVLIRCYDELRQPVDWSQKGMIYRGTGRWKQDSLFIDPDRPFVVKELVGYRPFSPEVRFISLHLYPSVPDRSGGSTGTVWFDELRFFEADGGKNLVPEGDFEQDIEKLKVSLDFTIFDKAARRYLDEFGFTGFRLKIDELKPGPFAGRKAAWFDGFIAGTPEYEKLISSYLGQLQDHLEANGWLGKEYVYWVDEPRQEDYGFVREGMEIIRRAAPKLTRLITENNPGPEIMDVTEIGCPVLAKFDPEKSREWIKKGRQMWSYLMTWPKAPHVNLFIDDDAINLRMWLWMSYRYELSGILIWCLNYWNTDKASPPGILQDKWKDPMVYWGNQEIPLGASAEFGNGDGMLLYPPKQDPNKDTTKRIEAPIPSIRLELLREGLDDYDYLKLLENVVNNATSRQTRLVTRARRLLTIGDDIFRSEQEYTKDPQVLLQRRKEIAELLCLFGTP